MLQKIDVESYRTNRFIYLTRVKAIIISLTLHSVEIKTQHKGRFESMLDLGEVPSDQNSKRIINKHSIPHF